MSYLTDHIFLSLHNKRLLKLKLEYNFLTLTCEYKQLLKDQILNCRPIQIILHEQMKQIYYALIYIGIIIISESFTLALVIFKHLCPDILYKSLLHRNWIAHESIAYIMENSLKQSTIAVIAKKIIDHPKLKQIAEICTIDFK